MASDLNVYDSSRIYRSSHPDRFNGLYVWSKSKALWFLTIKDNSTPTGPLDYNVARTDGSVYTELNITKYYGNETERLGRLPRKHSIGVSSSEWRYVPAAE